MLLILMVFVKITSTLQVFIFRLNWAVTFGYKFALTVGVGA